MTKNVLITGGSRGIGLGIAKELAKSGCHLAINGRRSPDQVVPMLDELKNLGAEVVYCQGDISRAKDRAKIIETALKKFKVLHVLVNNAGIAPKKRNDLLETEEDSYDAVMDTNLKGPFFMAQSIARHMIAVQATNAAYKGCIINISSISATIASINRGEYCLSKAGVSMMTKLFAVRLGEYNIPVYEVRPGIIETDMTQGVLDMYKGMIANRLTIQPRIGHSEDVGKAVSALVADQFPYSTGQVVMVDGGLSLPRL